MGTPSLYRDADRAALNARIRQLAPDSRALWGKMDVGQALAHCQEPLRVGLGELRARRLFVGILFGGLVRRKMVGPATTGKNLPTAAEFRVTGPRDARREGEALVALIERFAAAGVAGTLHPQHPFFGRMTSADWDVIMWKHIDHHVRQFGG